MNINDVMSGKGCKYRDLIDVLNKLQGIKKSSNFNIFKKKVDPKEEDIIERLSTLVEEAEELEVCKFILSSQTDIEILFGLSFDPSNKNKKLSEQCIDLCMKIISRVAEIVIDRDHGRRVFKMMPRVGYEDAYSEESRAKLIRIFDTVCCFVSVIIENDQKGIRFKLKKEKLKSFKSIESRLAEKDSEQKGKDVVYRDMYQILKSQIRASVHTKDEEKMLSITLAWFEIFGLVLKKQKFNSIEIKHENFHLETATRLYTKERFFDLLDYFLDILLEIEEHQISLISLMEKNIASYIDIVLAACDRSTLDKGLFEYIFRLINKMFQKRKKLLGSNSEGDDYDNYMSGMSNSEEKTPLNITTLSKELEDEKSSFEYLQKMTGKLYLQMIDKLMEEKSEYKIFSLFLYNEEYVSYLEVFDPKYSQKLIKKTLMQFIGYLEKAASDIITRDKLIVLLKIGKCDNHTCRCFISELDNIYFKLAQRSPLSSIKAIMQMHMELVKGLLAHDSIALNICDCYVRSFSKTFTSLLNQNYQTVDKITVQLMTICEIENQGEKSGLEIVDMRNTYTFNPRKFNLFCDRITINNKQVRMTREICESLLILLANLEGVLEFLSSQKYTIDLDLDEEAKFEPEEVINLLNDRWQVRLLSFRSVYIEISSEILKTLYEKESARDMFIKIWRFFTEKLFKLRGKSLHSFYLGFITNLFIKNFDLIHYELIPCFYHFMLMIDIYMKGLGYYDRDDRLPIPTKITKEWFGVVYEHLKVKTDPSNSKQLVVQLLLCSRLCEMLTRDPPILKVLIPLIFNVTKITFENFGMVNFKCKEIIEGVQMILDDYNIQSIDAVLVIIMRLKLTLFQLTSSYPSMPVVLFPFIIQGGLKIKDEGFNYRYFGDLTNWLSFPKTIITLIKHIDFFSIDNEPQKKLSKYLNYVVYSKPDLLSDIFVQLLDKCLDIKCHNEVFKLRMKMFVSFLTIEDSSIIDRKTLIKFIEKFESLLLMIVKEISSSNIKKQWFFIVLIKWLYLSTGTELPVQQIKDMVGNLKQTGDIYINENVIIFESYLSSIRGLFGKEKKELRVPSVFNENNILSKKKMSLLMKMFDNFYKNQSLEEEARLLQNNFNVNLFEFFSDDKRSMLFGELFDTLLKKIKPEDSKWIYLFDEKHCILYSLCDTDTNELCVIKRHISGKICWFVKESFEGIYQQKEGLEDITNENEPTISDSPPIDTPNNLLTDLLNKYRKNPSLLDQYSNVCSDEDILKLELNYSYPTRASFFDTYPDHLKSHWKNQSEENQGLLIRTGSSNNQSAGCESGGVVDQSENSDSFIGSIPRRSDSGISSKTSHDLRINDQTTAANKKKRPGNFSLNQPKIRFIIQNGLFSRSNPDASISSPLSDYHTIIPDPSDKDLCSRFKSSLTLFDKVGILNCFKVGILFIGPDQDQEERILANSLPESGLFNEFISSLGEKITESIYEKYLGNDVIQYQVGPLIPRSEKTSTFEVKRIVGNRPTLIIWSQNKLNINYEGIKSQFNRDIVIIEELPTGFLRVSSSRKIEDSMLEAVYRPDSFMSLCCLQRMIHSYIFATQMEINPKILNSLEKEYRTISPYLEARKKKLRDFTLSFAHYTKPMDIQTLTDMLFHNNDA